MRIDKDGAVVSRISRIPDILTIRLNDEDKDLLIKCKEIINQKKDSTALKQVFMIGAYVLHEKKTSTILNIVYDNKRKNKRLNIIDFE